MKNKYPIDISALRKAMIDSDIFTVSELSRRSGVGRDTLSKIFGGKMLPSFDVAVKLSLALSLTPEEAGEIFFVPNLREYVS